MAGNSLVYSSMDDSMDITDAYHHIHTHFPPEPSCHHIYYLHKSNCLGTGSLKPKAQALAVVTKLEQRPYPRHGPFPQNKPNLNHVEVAVSIYFPKPDPISALPTGHISPLPTEILSWITNSPHNSPFYTGFIESTQIYIPGLKMQTT